MSSSSPSVFSHGDFPLELIQRERNATVSVCLPAHDEARTIGRILQALVPLRDHHGVIDQLVVVDHSSDGTAEIAHRHGAEVYQQEQLAPEYGPVHGKGDAMWRALRVLHGEIVVFLDADSDDLGAHYVLGLIGPLVLEPEISFVKAFYRRPFRLGQVTLPHGGGRVTELMARPLLQRFYPELAAIRQPLAGEIAARRVLLERLPFVTGYGVDIGLLLDAYDRGGMGAIAQVDLDVRQNDHQPLHRLGPMAAAVLDAVTARLVREGRLDAGEAPAALERPPLASLPAAA